MTTDQHPDDIHDRGLAFDLQTLMARRRMLGVLGIAGAGTALAACGFIGPAGSSEANRTATAADGTVCLKDPVETNGPFPADGSNSKNGATVNALSQSGIMRADIRPSFAGMTPVADGAQLDLEITLVDVAKACAPLAGHVIYIWHCDAEGKYSIYDQADRNYLRGAGITDAKGQLKFTTVFPGCYAGRWPHIHFEVFADQAKAVNGANSLLISQFAMPADRASSLYAGNAVYAASVSNLAGISVSKDGVFSYSTPEQIAAQTPKISGEAASGLKASVTVGIVGA